MMLPQFFFFFYGWVYERNESQSEGCKYNAEPEWNGLGGGGMPVCRK